MTRPFVRIPEKLLEVPEVYPKGAKGRFVNNQKFVAELNKHVVKDIRDACVQNNNPRAKRKSSMTESYLCVC